MYIIIDGIGGAGKSTLVAALVECIRPLGITGIALAEPTYGQFGQKIRKLASTPGQRDRKEEHELFTKDREEHVKNKIHPLLAFIAKNPGFILIQDRGYLSAPAYQAENENEMQKFLDEQRKIAPAPDYFFILELPVEISRARSQDRGETKTRFEDPKIVAVARQRYLQMAEEIEEKVVVLDATKKTDILCREIIKILGLA